MNYPKVLAEFQAIMLPQGRNGKGFCMPPFLVVERRHYLLNQA
jgi:hypothetical protein